MTRRWTFFGITVGLIVQMLGMTTQVRAEVLKVERTIQLPDGKPVPGASVELSARPPVAVKDIAPVVSGADRSFAFTWVPLLQELWGAATPTEVAASPEKRDQRRSISDPPADTVRIGSNPLNAIALNAIATDADEGQQEFDGIKVKVGEKQHRIDSQTKADSQTKEQGDATLKEVDLVAPPGPPAIPVPTRYETRQQLEESLRQFLLFPVLLSPAFPVSSTDNAISDALRRTIELNQPAAGDILLAQAIDPQQELHRQAAIVFVGNLALMSAEQITAYLRGAIQLGAKLRPQYPEGFNAPVRFFYAVRHEWQGLGQQLKLKTHTTHWVDGQQMGSKHDYDGPMATTGWLYTGNLKMGEHIITLKMEFEWEFNNQRGTGAIESAPFKLNIVNADQPDDLIARRAPEDEQLVRSLFKVNQDPPPVQAGGGQVAGVPADLAQPGAPVPEVTWKDNTGRSYALRCPRWTLERALPFALTFDVAIHEVETGRVVRGSSLFIPAGKAFSGYFSPYLPRELSQGRTGLVPVKIVLSPSYVIALSDPEIKAFFGRELVFENVHFEVVRR